MVVQDYPLAMNTIYGSDEFLPHLSIITMDTILARYLSHRSRLEHER